MLPLLCLYLTLCILSVSCSRFITLSSSREVFDFRADLRREGSGSGSTCWMFFLASAVPLLWQQHVIVQVCHGRSPSSGKSGIFGDVFHPKPPLASGLLSLSTDLLALRFYFSWKFEARCAARLAAAWGLNPLYSLRVCGVLFSFLFHVGFARWARGMFGP